MRSGAVTSERVRVGRVEGPERRPAKTPRTPERLADENRRLVEHLLNRKFGHAAGELREELRAVGLAALAEAADRFDPSRGAQFGTYAYRYIWGALMKAHEKATAAALPRFVSIDAPAAGGEDDTGAGERLTVGSLLADPEGGADRPALDAEGVAAFWANVGRLLRPRDARVIALRYGGADGCGEPLTMQQVADLLGVSRQAVHQVEQRALKELRARWRPEWWDLVARN